MYLLHFAGVCALFVCGMRLVRGKMRRELYVEDVDWLVFIMFCWFITLLAATSVANASWVCLNAHIPLAHDNSVSRIGPIYVYAVNC